MGQLPLQDTWQFRSFRSESKLEQRGQLKETNINHKYPSLYVVRRFLCFYVVYVKLTLVVSWVCSRPMCAEMSSPTSRMKKKKKSLNGSVNENLNRQKHTASLFCV